MSINIKAIPYICKSLLGLLAILLLFSSCRTGKELALFQDLNSEQDAKVQQVRTAAFDPLRLQPDDQLQIVISSISPEASQLFNLMGSAVITGNNNTQNMQSVYSVSPSGNITIPVVGDVKVAGLTTDEAKAQIKEVVSEYLKDAVISVTLINFRVTVMGEVTRPSTFQVAGEKINVLQAIGMAGDLTVFAKRTNIKVIRKVADKVEVAHLNLNNSSVMRSPYYNLRQNDVVLVEPGKRKGLQAEGLNIIVPAATSILSLIIVAITRFR
ncbi:polysaccharide biosynthesis/export family protein [Agriterribacter humi]|uniref:polysaccharide biosynthesis/export family protein n=1 Tax=Agriterribacter humi TaxID=1104781 RepID=UPI00186B1268|nr:polysaccharide biosynthesis/export family protein [Agriterribacter humi]